MKSFADKTDCFKTDILYKAFQEFYTISWSDNSFRPADEEISFDTKCVKILIRVMVSESVLFYNTSAISLQTKRRLDQVKTDEDTRGE